MPTRDQHLKQAKENEEFAEFLLRSSDGTAITWAATAMFYSALHYGCAFLVANKVSVSTHTGFETRFKNTWRPRPNIYPHYQRLKDDSEDARYSCIAYTEAQVRRLRDQHLHPFRDAIVAVLTTAP